MDHMAKAREDREYAAKLREFAAREHRAANALGFGSDKAVQAEKEARYWEDQADYEEQEAINPHCSCCGMLKSECLCGPHAVCCRS